MKKIVILAFNYGNAGNYVNGPGMCLFSFTKLLRSKGFAVDIFSKLKTNFQKSTPVKDMKSKDLYDRIEDSDIVHHWSGLNPEFLTALQFARSKDKYIISGPNVLDGVRYKEEERYLAGTNIDKFLTVNDKLKKSLSRKYNIDLKKLSVLMVGPDPELWSPTNIDNGRILWKGNSRQPVKDIKFGLEVAKKMPQYKFDFVGYPQPYNYFAHIEDAKKYHLYFSTSLSETMGLAVWEQNMARIPAITHPAIHFNRENYVTGIITKRTINDYCSAIDEVMTNSKLHLQLSNSAGKYAMFKHNSILPQYIEILSEIK